ncbi:MAG TPA: hypothetical protein VFK06_24545 [Candidatus Angelobacter sp.]|nr:hypothetical protein [Candidatus Angelobacter sp.]
MRLNEVTKDKFFGELYARKEDIMPMISKHTYPYHQIWSNVRTSEVFGKTEDEVTSGVCTTRYFLA